VTQNSTRTGCISLRFCCFSDAAKQEAKHPLPVFIRPHALQIKLLRQGPGNMQYSSCRKEDMQDGPAMINTTGAKENRHVSPPPVFELFPRLPTVLAIVGDHPQARAPFLELPLPVLKQAGRYYDQMRAPICIQGLPGTCRCSLHLKQQDLLQIPFDCELRIGAGASNSGRAVRYGAEVITDYIINRCGACASCRFCRAGAEHQQMCKRGMQN